MDKGFLGFYLLGLLGIFFIKKEKVKQHNRGWYVVGWSFINLISYLLYLSIHEKSYLIFIPLLFFSFFAFSYWKEKRRLINGLFFNLALVSFGLWLLLFFLETGNFLLGTLLGIAGVFFFLVLLVGIYGLLVFLYWNGLVVLKKEKHSLANLLTLLLAIGLTILLLINVLVIHHLPLWLSQLFAILPLCMGYFGIVFYNFLTVSLLYQLNHPRLQQDYIIVLGAGLIGGTYVSPLLAQRIDRGISFYKKQLAKTGKTAKFIMSGGQGTDEKIPEAVAMKNYAVSQGIPAETILLEANSTTTLENMKFSKELISKDTVGNYHAIFSSNNYHIFRAGLFAKEAGLAANGIGSKTAFYFLPNAFLREFVAIIMMHKKRHLFVCGLITSLMFFISLVQFFFG